MKIGLFSLLFLPLFTSFIPPKENNTIKAGLKMQDFVIVVCNFTPEVHYGSRIGVPQSGKYLEVLNSDATEFGGSGVSNIQELNTEPISWHNQENSLVLTLPPLSTIYLKITRE